MKILCVPDIHGRNCWKKIVEKENPDRVIFLGDYFDCFETADLERLNINPKLISKDSIDISATEQIQNFLDIIKLKEESGKDVKMLIGNHDFHYFYGMRQYIEMSGYQIKHAMFITQAIEDNKHHLQMAHREGDIIFSHAGISSVWLNDSGYDGIEPIEDFVNNMFRYKPLSFLFYGRNSYGNDVTQSPIWIRPQALMIANKNTLRKQIIQIAGHTHVDSIDMEGKTTGKRYYFTDTFGNIDKEYLIIEDGKIISNRL